MLIELHVFSGQSNPRWELDALQALALVALQRDLKPSRHAPSVPPTIGYSGFSYVDQGRPWSRTMASSAGRATSSMTRR